MVELKECPWIHEFRAYFADCFNDNLFRLDEIEDICTERNGGVFYGRMDNTLVGFCILEKRGDIGFIHAAKSLDNSLKLFDTFLGAMVAYLKGIGCKQIRLETSRHGIVRQSALFGFRAVSMILELE